MNILVHYSLLLLIPTTVLLHLVYSPYTKVEESFNIQAIHDIVTYGVPVQTASERLEKHYDHLAFPGAVPRTFVGALSVAGVSWPFLGWLSDSVHQQILVRAVIGLANSLTLLAFYNAVSQSLGRVAGYWYILFQASQFHVMYYASRTLPNMYAFALTTLAHRHLLLSNFGNRTKRASRIKIALYLLTLSGIIFRSEIALLLLTHVVWLLLSRSPSLGYSSLAGRLTLLRRIIIPAGIASLAIALTVTVTIDTFFWQSPVPLWPEWLAFRFNTLEGHASDWGTSPWHFYFSSSLPKLLLNPLTWSLCIPVALADKLTRRFCVDILAPLLGFVGLYSALPHKEWRFIVYVLPGLTAVAGAGAAYISNRAFAREKPFTRTAAGKTSTTTKNARKSYWIYRTLTLTLAASVLASFGASLGQLHISSLNYPGAHALRLLHEHADVHDPGRPLVRVHLENLACQTGVTRFLQREPLRWEGLRQDVGVGRNGWEERTVWYYDKSGDEGEKEKREFWERWDYVVVEEGWEGRVKGEWDVVGVVEGFAGVEVVREDIGSGKGHGKGEVGKTDDRVVDQAWMCRSYADGSQWKTKLKEYLVRFESLAKRYMTGGRWVRLKTEPKLWVLRKWET